MNKNGGRRSCRLIMAECPLNDEHCATLDKILQSTHEALDLASKCKNCGWDVDAFIEQLKAQRDMAAKTKATFFPTRS